MSVGKRPDRPVLVGVHISRGNRFTWDFGKIPSPKRSGAYPTTTEHVPVICQWCGGAYWPPATIIQGCCDDACTQALRAYLDARETRHVLMERLGEAEVPTAVLEAMLRQIQELLAEEQAENAALRGLSGKGQTT